MGGTSTHAVMLSGAECPNSSHQIRRILCIVLWRRNVRQAVSRGWQIPEKHTIKLIFGAAELTNKIISCSSFDVCFGNYLRKMLMTCIEYLKKRISHCWKTVFRCILSAFVKICIVVTFSALSVKINGPPWFLRFDYEY